MLLFKRVNSRHFFLTHISSLFCSFSLGTVKKKKKKKKIKSESETRPLDSSEFHDDAFVFSIIVVLVGVILGVRGILRASLRGENQPLVYDFPVGDLGGVTSVDAVGETIHHAMRVFTVTLCDRARNARLVDEARVRNSARDGD